jgi:N6-adenosine-specific RNA methylase IME4
MSADALAAGEVTEVSGKVVDLRTGEVIERSLAEEASRQMLAVARRALEEADSLPALASLAHRADVTRIAARKAKLSEEACLDWEEFSLDAQREAGKMLATMDKQAGARGIGKRTGEVEAHDAPPLPPKLEELGVSRIQSQRWQAVASLPDEVYEEYKDKARAKGEITRAGVIKLAKQTRADEVRNEPVIVPVGTFSTLVADPPWRYGNTATRAAAQDHYDTLSIAQLCGKEPMPDGTNLADQVVKPRVAECAHLYLWTTAGHLPEAFEVMEAWGFTYKTYLVWVKPQMGMGNYFRVSTELVLFGVRGDMRTNDMGTVNYFNASRGKHSAKPSVFYDLVAKSSPGPYLEMFARCDAANQIPGTCQCSKCLRGWAVWGNQA